MSDFPLFMIHDTVHVAMAHFHDPLSRLTFMTELCLVSLSATYHRLNRFIVNDMLQRLVSVLTIDDEPINHLDRAKFVI